MKNYHDLLKRTHFDAPVLKLSDNIRPVKNLDEIPGVFARIQPSDIALEGYECHGAIKAPMAA